MKFNELPPVLQRKYKGKKIAHISVNNEGTKIIVTLATGRRDEWVFTSGFMSGWHLL